MSDKCLSSCENLHIFIISVLVLKIFISNSYSLPQVELLYMKAGNHQSVFDTVTCMSLFRLGIFSEKPNACSRGMVPACGALASWMRYRNLQWLVSFYMVVFILIDPVTFHSVIDPWLFGRRFLMNYLWSTLIGNLSIFLRKFKLFLTQICRYFYFLQPDIQLHHLLQIKLLSTLSMAVPINTTMEKPFHPSPHNAAFWCTKDI